MIELVVVVIYWTDCMPRKFGNDIRLPGTTGIDNLPIPLTTRRSVEHCTPHADGAWLNELGWSQ